jgi:hypothetical protein
LIKFFVIANGYYIEFSNSFIIAEQAKAGEEEEAIRYKQDSQQQQQKQEQRYF